MPDNEKMLLEGKEEFLASLEPVGHISLHNKGWFVARMNFLFQNENGNTGHLAGSGKDILKGKAESQELCEFGMPEGAICTIRADVVWGSGKSGQMWFKHESGSKRRANFVIAGTTLGNTLGFVSCDTVD